MLATRSTAKFLDQQRLELQDLSSHSISRERYEVFRDFHGSQRVRYREFAIPSPFASYPTRAASHSANLGALFGSRTNISRSVSYLWFAQHLRSFVVVISTSEFA